MELSEVTYDNILNFVNKSNKDKDLEFELRFTNQEINQKTFESIFNKLTFSNSNNGLGFKYEMIHPSESSFKIIS